VELADGLSSTRNIAGNFRDLALARAGLASGSKREWIAGDIVSGTGKCPAPRGAGD
jgi:hypothetical protein